jgi:hypothetical protein
MSFYDVPSFTQIPGHYKTELRRQQDEAARVVNTALREPNRVSNTDLRNPNRG